jgi:hypothetical protein
MLRKIRASRSSRCVIAIGVGANAAMFSLADTLVLRPLTFPVRANRHRHDRRSQVGFRESTSQRCISGLWIATRHELLALLVSFVVVSLAVAPINRLSAVSEWPSAAACSARSASSRSRPRDRRRRRPGVGRDPVVVLDTTWRQQFTADPECRATDSSRRREMTSWRRRQRVHRTRPVRAALVLRAVRPNQALLSATTSSVARRDVHNIRQGRLKPVCPSSRRPKRLR